MSGDRLKALEVGFLEGRLTPNEETELKRLVAEQPDHHLSLYFDWANDTNLQVPDMRERLNLDDTSTIFWKQNLFRIAASLLVILTATFVFQPELFKTKPDKTYSQVEIDESYETTMKTLTAMAIFLNESLPQAEKGMNISAPFKEFNTLDNTETQE